MDSKQTYTSNHNDPNKTKKCNCENKVGPKPFNTQSKTK